MPDLGIIEDGSRILSKFSSLHQSSTCSDVTLVVGKEKLVAHRFVLGANSRVFEMLLFGTNFSEYQQKEVKIDAPVEAFKILLKFMYTGTLKLREFDVEDVADLLELCHRYEIGDIERRIVDYLCVAVNAESAVKVLEVARLFQLHRLEELCWNLVEMTIQGIYEAELDLCYELLAGLVFHKERRVSEVNLFKLVSKLTSTKDLCTQEQKKELFLVIELNKMNMLDLCSVVRPTKNYKDSLLLKVFDKIGREDAQKINRDMKLQEKVKVFAEKGAQNLFSTGLDFTSFNFKKSVSKNKNFVLVDLGKIFTFNHIKFQLEIKKSATVHTYIIEVSKDKENWDKVVDYSAARSCQKQSLYFTETKARFIKIIGTNVLYTEEFALNSFDVLFVEDLPKSFAAFIIPQTNDDFAERPFANYTISNKICKFESELLNGNYEDKGLETPYTSQIIEHGSLYLFYHQPYILSSCRFRLWDFDGRKYSYKVEVSLDLDNFQIISDKSEEKVGGWQIIRFTPRPVFRFRITGISATIGNELRLVHFEAPSQI